MVAGGGVETEKLGGGGDQEQEVDERDDLDSQGGGVDCVGRGAVGVEDKIEEGEEDEKDIGCNVGEDMEGDVKMG